MHPFYFYRRIGYFYSYTHDPSGNANITDFTATPDGVQLGVTVESPLAAQTFVCTPNDIACNMTLAPVATTITGIFDPDDLLLDVTLDSPFASEHVFGVQPDSMTMTATLEEGQMEGTVFVNDPVSLSLPVTVEPATITQVAATVAPDDMQLKVVIASTRVLDGRPLVPVRSTWVIWHMRRKEMEKLR